MRRLKDEIEKQFLQTELETLTERQGRLEEQYKTMTEEHCPFLTEEGDDCFHFPGGCSCKGEPECEKIRLELLRVEEFIAGVKLRLGVI